MKGKNYDGRRFTEKGYGSNTHGSATILANLEGKPLNQKVVIMPDGHQASEHYLWPNNPKLLKKSYFSDEGLYQLILKRNGNIALLKVIKWADRNLTPSEGECGIIIDTKDNSWKAIFDSSMVNGAETSELASNLLSDAVSAALGRSMTQNPESIFYGFMALDSFVIEKREVPNISAKEKVQVSEV